MTTLIANIISFFHVNVDVKSESQHFNISVEFFAENNLVIYLTKKLHTEAVERVCEWVREEKVSKASKIKLNVKRFLYECLEIFCLSIFSDVD